MCLCCAPPASGTSARQSSCSSTHAAAAPDVGDVSRSKSKACWAHAEALVGDQGSEATLRASLSACSPRSSTSARFAARQWRTYAAQNVFSAMRFGTRACRAPRRAGSPAIAARASGRIASSCAALSPPPAGSRVSSASECGSPSASSSAAPSAAESRSMRACASGSRAPSVGSRKHHGAARSSTATGPAEAVPGAARMFSKSESSVPSIQRSTVAMDEATVKATSERSAQRPRAGAASAPVAATGLVGALERCPFENPTARVRTGDAGADTAPGRWRLKPVVAAGGTNSSYAECTALATGALDRA
mmetsp:Transcript_4685/g.12053  ORF Transcript_4685/g.12053 Transcript_4685/m.12053 type:complete len:306 (+) Transcript_4685:176-1093(+)